MPADHARLNSAVLLRRGLRTVNGLLAHESVLLAALLGVTIPLGCATVIWAGSFPASLLVLPVLLGGVFLSFDQLRWIVAVTGVFLLAAGFAGDMTGEYVGATIAVLIAAAVSLALARSRARLGVTGTTGESMLVDLRDRLTAHGKLPSLPPGWEVEMVHRSAGRSQFSGDFFVAARSSEGFILEVALVDVSGKGHGAGTRALLLSGAFGGLLGSLPPAEFLPAANAYLLRQGWSEGFATAVHAVVDLTSGRFEIRSAGHPPAIHYQAGSGRWTSIDASGSLLGVFEKEHYEPVVGLLRPNDALMLYTDGLVEAPRRDLSDGIDKLQGEAERLVTRGFRNGAHRLIDAVASSENDDRALLLLWRT
ncbi:PP2C family protein-serine/threonine phosphatase [Phytoactinopolyspora halotolerans]|uniref:Serine/threonine-protein phosphatase n=1 Tax=Phytoactinopolyspora halotolerans TaxID=1981512 RepID=A0A6L9S915_9ACTN|nr:PP2C family protein-serine/threonine phosphatase [Phytoactinopolyspora halotolerans]NEE01559.1 serine/threonine-protein phosphatase [Phytoactinopolyspora halotolerans]